MTVTTPVVGLWSMIDMVSTRGGFCGGKLLGAAGSVRLGLGLDTRALKDKVRRGYTGDPARDLQLPSLGWRFMGSIFNQFLKPASPALILVKNTLVGSRCFVVM